MYYFREVVQRKISSIKGQFCVGWITHCALPHEFITEDNQNSKNSQGVLKNDQVKETTIDVA